MQSAVEVASTPRVKAAALARVASFAACVVVVVSSFAFREVRADVRERLFDAGEAMMTYPGTPRDAVRQLRLNGIQISFRARAVGGRLEEVLGHYEALCNSSAIAADAQRNRDAGYVACLSAGDTALDTHAVVERLVQFARSGELFTLGGFRYVFARQVESHGDPMVLLLTAWSDSTFDLAGLLPTAGGDAAGSDPPGLPRLPGMRRILSASEFGRPSGVYIYRVQHDDIDDFRTSYRRRLIADGWSIIERNPGESIQIDDIRLIAAENDGTLVTMLMQRGDSGRPILTILTSEPS